MKREPQAVVIKTSRSTWIVFALILLGVVLAFLSFAVPPGTFVR
ncbi:MAG TPA: hypothetical protein VMH20_05515 [Verrucomicrobiae bacterium]|nr:hypothetical protein [Verrucomicrobiae bacterium]